jgi:hypothetical protein
MFAFYKLSLTARNANILQGVIVFAKINVLDWAELIGRIYFQTIFKAFAFLGAEANSAII